MLRRRVVVEKPTKIGRILQRISFGGLLASNLFGCTEKKDEQTLELPPLKPIIRKDEEIPLEPLVGPTRDRRGYTGYSSSSRLALSGRLSLEDKLRLRNEFGISHPERYDASLLKGLLGGTTTDKKIIAVITTRGESEGRTAFTIRKPKYLHKQRFRSHEVIAMEAGSRNEVLERLKQISSLGNIAVIILRAHGNTTGMNMHEDEKFNTSPAGSILVGDEEFTSAINELAPNLEVIGLDSCEGAFTNGLARFLAQKTCVNVTGQAIAGSGEIVLSESDSGGISLGVISSGTTEWSVPASTMIPPESCEKIKSTIVVYLDLSDQPGKVNEKESRATKLPEIELDVDVEDGIRNRIGYVLNRLPRYKDKEIEYEAVVRVNKRSLRLASLILYEIKEDGTRARITGISDLSIIDIKLPDFRSDEIGVVTLVGYK